MAVFRTIHDLRTSLRETKLAPHAQAIAGSARPTILFVRRQEPDDALPVGTSKIGGNPDLPENFVWPIRPPYPDAESRATALMKIGAYLRESMASRMDEPPKARRIPITSEMLDDITEKYRGKSDFFFNPFPLSFYAQLNLAELAKEDGFDEDLPRTGLLSIFCDLMGGTSGTPRLYWHDVASDKLLRREIPMALRDYYNCYCDERPEDGSWANLTQAEVLYPFSAVTPPDHWQGVFSSGSATAEAISDWFEGGHLQLDLSAEAEAIENSASFGDRLGGWPQNIQGNPEDDLDDGHIIEPGNTLWRHIFSFGGENWDGTRLIALENTSDGNTFVMIRDRDLIDRRFDRAQSVHQRT